MTLAMCVCVCETPFQQSGLVYRVTTTCTGMNMYGYMPTHMYGYICIAIGKREYLTVDVP